MKPVFRMIAGPNGSGKSSLTRSLSVHEGMIVLDPDAVARELNPEHPQKMALEAGRRVLQRMADYFERGQSFSIETTLSSQSNLEWIRKARRNDFFVEFFYIALENPQINVSRVNDRVHKGGHFVPLEDILRRYERSMINLKTAVALADTTVILDNSDEMLKVLQFEQGFVTWRSKYIPKWVTRALNIPLE
jgi:predicted ABC-type ATPase